jgi:hypothetical protein
MGFYDEMKELLKLERLYTLEEKIKMYGSNINDSYKYFIDFNDGLTETDNYNIHYHYNYWGSPEYHKILNKYGYGMEWLGGDVVGIYKHN